MESPRCGQAYSAGQMLSKCYPTGSLESAAISGLAVRRNVGLGSPTNSQPGRLRYVAQASGLRVLAASSRQFWWYLQDAPESRATMQLTLLPARFHFMLYGLSSRWPMGSSHGRAG